MNLPHLELLETRRLWDALPDLAVTSLHATTGVVLRPNNDGIRVTGAVKNIGTAAFPDVKTVRLFLSTAPVPGQGTDYGLGTLSLGEIAAGDSVAFDRTADIPSNAPVGSYYLTAMADPTDAVTEADETNNTRGTPKALVVVSDFAAPVPDSATLDATFGTNGIARQTLAGQRLATDATAVDSQGRIVVAGGFIDSGLDVLLRFNADGTFDTTFGTGGIVTTNIYGGNFGSPLALTPDGKIVLAGTAIDDDDNYTFGVYRFNADGTPDASFGADGLLTFDPSLVLAGANGAFALTTDLPHTQDDFAAGVKQTPADALPKYPKTVPSAKADKRATTNNVVSAAAVDAKGNIYVSGSVGLGNDRDFAVIKLTSAGAYDTTFNGTGAAAVDFNGLDDEASSVVLAKDGGVILAGDSTDSASTNGNIAVAKLTAAGQIDTKFSGGGFILGPGGSITSAHAALVDPKGRLIISGSTSVGTIDDMLTGKIITARFSTTGRPDASFATKGRSEVAIPGFDQNTAASVALDAKDRVVIGAVIARDVSAVFNDRSGLAVIRLTKNGDLDTTFGSRGHVVLFTPVEPALPSASSLFMALDAQTADDFARTGQAQVAVTPGGEVLAIAASVSDADTQVTLASIVPDGPNLSATVTGAPAKSVAGTPQVFTVKLSNLGSLKASGAVQLSLTLGESGASFAAGTQVVAIAPGTSRSVKMTAAYDSNTATASTVVFASVSSVAVIDTDVTDNTGMGKAVQVIAQSVDLAAAATGASRTGVTAKVSNAGNVATTQSVLVQAFASADGVTNGDLLASATLDLSLATKKNASKKLTFATTTAAHLRVVITPVTDAVSDNNSASARLR